MNPQPATILLVDDDELFRRTVKRELRGASYRVIDFPNGEECLASLDHTVPDTVILDLHMDGIGGLATLKRLHSTNPALPVIMLTGDADVSSVVEAMQAGAYDYLAKPTDTTKLLTTVRNAIKLNDMSGRLRLLEREASGEGYGDITGRSKAMRNLFRQLDRLAASDVTVLINGESGTGKELVARAIHDSSSRHAAPFIALNCAAISESLQESELFGHERGSFTGASDQRKGRFEQAHRGTLLLDEVAELSPRTQAVLLRALQERSFYRVGGTESVRVDVRVIAATHVDLFEAAERGRFRSDLYYRLAVYELEVPALRERADDIPLLAKRFARQYAEQHGRPPLELAPETLDRLESHSWPGNVRELQNAMQRAVVACPDRVILPQHLPKRILHRRERTIRATPPAAPAAAAPMPSGTIEDIERETIRRTLEQTGGNVSEVCRVLEIPRTTLYRKLKKYGLR